MDTKKMMVTGESGFMGSHLVPMLLKQGHEVYSLHRHVSNRPVNSEANIVYGDIKDSVFLNKEIPMINPEVIIHLAGLTPVSLSHEQPIEYTETNYVGTLNLAHASMKCSNLKMFLYNTTSECYGIQDDEDIPINESAQLKPNTPYAVSKAASEMYFKYYLGPAYNFPYFLVCPFNTYGRKNTNHFVVESVITKMLQNKDKIHVGDLKPVRDFVYIDDVMKAYDLILNGTENPFNGLEYIPTNWKMNVCTGVGISIEKLIGLIAEKLDWRGQVIPKSTYQRPTEIPTLIGNHTALTLNYGWRSEVELEEGIERTIKFWSDKLEL